MIDIIRYASQTLILCVSVPIILALGFGFFPVFNIMGWWAIILPILGISASYATLWLLELVDEWADPLTA